MAPDCLCKGKRFSLSFTRSVFIAWSPRKPSLSVRDRKNFISPFYLCYRLWGRRENMKAKLLLFPGPASCSLRRKQIIIQISGKNEQLLRQPFLIVLPDKNEFECLHRDLKRFPPLERPAHAQQVLLLLFIYLFVCLFAPPVRAKKLPNHRSLSDLACKQAHCLHPARKIFPWIRTSEPARRQLQITEYELTIQISFRLPRYLRPGWW